jgi:hypothetical protein
MSVAFGVCAAIIVMLIIPLFKRRLKGGAPNYYELNRAFAVIGFDKTTEIFAASFPSSLIEKFEPKYLILNLGDGMRLFGFPTSGKTLLFLNFKFANTNEDEIAAAYRYAAKNNVKNIIAIGAEIPRSARVLGAAIDGVHFMYPLKSEVKKYVRDKNIVPQTLSRGVKLKGNFDALKAAFSMMFERRRIKYYIFTGLTLFAVSFVTPLKVYYTVLAVVPLVLAAIAAFKAAVKD